MKIFYITLFSVLFSGSASGQKQIDPQHNSWYMYFGNHRITERWGLHTEYQFRRSGWIEKWQQSLLRVGVDHYFKQGVQLTAGYGWIVSYPYGKQPIANSFTEHRIWQQLILKQDAWRFNFNHRFRLEQRFLENRVADSTGEYQLEGFNYRNRGRYRFMITVPLSRAKMKNNTLFLSLYEEVFIGFGKGIGKNILDQNRLYAALGWKFFNNLNIQLGYLNHYVIKSDGIYHERNHTLQLSCTYNLDFRKKEKE
jgi:hypothetical protein